MKTMVRPSFLAFFLTPASASLPLPDLLFVPLHRPSAGPLATPSQLPQNPPGMAGVVADPALFLDQVGDPRRCPQTALVAAMLAALASGRVRCAAGLLGADALC